MYRGRHHRNWIRCYDLDNNGYDEYEVLHEEAATGGHGLFSVIEHYYRNKPFYVVWRKNRNTTRDTTVMRDPLGGEHVWQREEVGYASLSDAVASLPSWNACFEFPEKRKRYRVRDAQKSKVYRWEHKMAADIGLTEQVVGTRWPNGSVDYVMRNKLERRRSHDFLQNALEHICINLDEKAPELKFRTGGRCSYGGYDIRLLPSHCNLLILLHELAHVLHRRWGNNGHQSHGKEFVGIYSYLLIRFGEVDRDAIVRHAANARVKLLLPDRYWDWEEVRNQRKAA